MTILKWGLATIAGIAAVAGIAVASYGRDKSAFVGKCWQNGRAIADCACMYEAYADYLTRRDLPPIYGQLVKSWAHEPASDYRQKIYTTVFWQSVRAVPVVRDVIFEKGTETTGSDGVWGKVSKSVSEHIASQIGRRLGIVILPWVHTAKTAKEAAEPVWDYAKARSVVSKHCGGRTHNIVAPIENAQKQIMEQIDVYRGAITDAVARVKAGGVTVDDIKTTAQTAATTAKDKTLQWYEAGKAKVMGWLKVQP